MWLRGGQGTQFLPLRQPGEVCRTEAGLGGKASPRPGKAAQEEACLFLSESRNTWNEGSQRGIVTRDLLGMAEDDGEDEDSR